MRTPEIMKAFFITVFLFFALSLWVFAQDKELETLYVAGMAVFLENEFVAQEIRDANGQICGMIKINSDLTGLTFNASNGVIRVNDEQQGQYKVFLQPGERILEVYKWDIPLYE